jgi:hypothetical protein
VKNLFVNPSPFKISKKWHQEENILKMSGNFLCNQLKVKFFWNFE